MVGQEAFHEVGDARRPGDALRVLGIGYVVMAVSLLALGLVVTHTLEGSLGRWDLEVNRWLVDHRSDVWNTATRAVTLGLNTVPVIVVAVITVGILVARHRWREALLIAFALTLEVAVFLSVTFVVARPRPDVPRLNATPATSSFPSGHTAAALVLYAGIALVVSRCSRNRVIRVLVWPLAVAVVVSVGFARVYRGMHHPSDVVVGAAFGVACLWFANRAVRVGFPHERSADHDPTADRPPSIAAGPGAASGEPEPDRVGVGRPDSDAEFVA